MVYLLKDNVLCLDNDMLLTYTALRSMYHNNNKIMYVSINQMCYELCGNINYTRAFKECVISGFDKLCAEEFIAIKDKISKTEFVLDLSGLYFEKEYFVEVDLEYIRKVCNCPCRVDKSSLLKYFLTMVGTFSHSIFAYKGIDERTGFVGFMPITYIAKQAEISEQTAMSYNTILEDNKIIYIFRHNGYYQDDYGNIRTVNNHYGLYENKKDIIRFGKAYEKEVV